MDKKSRSCTSITIVIEDAQKSSCGDTPHDVSQSEVLGRFYNSNTTPKDKERVVVCLRGTGQELH
ncbi:hypothetical protein SCLCIDRAFT_24034 [Scleroderma citrinum Foug A]|uniref:Uncharacterized protein n=1 Tax=Scleroderma citrinum Foug A TaxID=1036808 RepID=A0A0C2ZPY1_9AGAM|nr:hypothetical protein SCLCIDRAFT_24034 [Scleroderma citrinum Foug A]